MKNQFILIILFVTLNCLNTKAQSFERVEVLAGLGVLQENNGASVADIDGDNDLDLFVVAKNIDENGSDKTISRLFRNNNNGSFTDITEESALISTLSQEETKATGALSGFKFGASWGDINNDGFPDIIITSSLKIQLFLNLTNGTFQDITSTSGIQGASDCVYTSATWFDYNNDGYLDLFLSSWDECNGPTLYENNKNNTFTDRSNILPVVENKFYFQGFPFDFNNDGFLDLYISNDLENPNSLFINNNGNGFIEEGILYGMNSAVDDMGIAIGDYNNDGDFDFYVTAINENIFYDNDGNNMFTDIAQDKNLFDTGWAWDVKFSDFDLDGDEDLFIVNGFDFTIATEEYNVYYKNLLVEGQESFTEIGSSLNLRDLTRSNSAVDFDYDNDGDVDIFVTNIDRPSYLYENKILNFDESSTLNWFKVILQGTISNRDAIGTKLELKTSQGTIIRFYTGMTFLGQNLQPVHFGLQQGATIEELTITWPSGIIENHQGLNINNTIKAIEGDGYQVLNIEPSQKILGCTDPDSCTYNPQATLNDGSCEYLTSNEIIGASTSSFYSVESYQYNIDEGSQALWTISGGEILSGQGTNTITVKWHIESQGEVKVREFNNSCYSDYVVKSVQLNIQNASDNISIARLWNEALLEAIRGDYARPTVHARNLFHTSIAMYDAWAIYDEEARPYLIGNIVGGFNSELLDFVNQESITESRKKAISYAAYKLLSHRFVNSPGAEKTQERIDLIMQQLGYNTEFNGVNYTSGDPAALGNYIAQTIINYGNQDGARESSDYDNAYYESVNTPLNPNLSDNPFDIDPNRWQALSLNGFVDQSGNLISGDVIDFLSPEWGDVKGFALTNEEMSVFQRNGDTYKVYHDPTEPPYLDTNQSQSSEAYKWGFSMVSVWQSHLDPAENVLWDISPKSIGNLDINNFPNSYTSYPNFYNFFEGGDDSQGHLINPVTGLAYESQMVPRGDYARVLAEFWADGPDSETPPGHWFTILNYVNDNPIFEKRFQGVGEVLDPLEWDVKAYFILGGTMHDAAISAWSIKGWYDYIRPVSAIRFMASRGQSSDENAPNYNSLGIPLIQGYIELVQPGDPLEGFFGENVNKIKLYTWRGHDYIQNTETDTAGVGWILAENWWPYQRPNFVTPPFAGYVSGHSTYSRAAAEVMTAITGSPYFPGGMGEFIAKKNEFLVFEEGPSVDVKLQWATYRDASDQCSLSRIWGGIHPPADDIPGRLIGEKLGLTAFNYALSYFSSDSPQVDPISKLYPNPVNDNVLNISNTEQSDDILIFDMVGRVIMPQEIKYNNETKLTSFQFPGNLSPGLYLVKVNNESKIIILQNKN